MCVRLENAGFDCDFSTLLVDSKPSTYYKRTNDLSKCKKKENEKKTKK